MIYSIRKLCLVDLFFRVYVGFYRLSNDHSISNTIVIQDLRNILVYLQDGRCTAVY